MIAVLFLAAAAVAWMAYDTGYDTGWWDGRYPEHSDGDPHV